MVDYATMYGTGGEFFDFGRTETDEDRRKREAKELEDQITREEALSGTRSPLRDLGPAPIQGVDNPVESQNSGIGKELYNVTGGVRHFAGGFLGTMARAPWDVASFATRNAPYDPLANATKEEQQAQQIALADELARQGKGAEGLIKTFTGASEPTRNVVEEQASHLGEALTPAGKFTAPLTAASYLIGLFNRPDQRDVQITEHTNFNQPTTIEPQPSWLDTVLTPGTYSFVNSAEAAPKQPRVSQTSVTVETQGGPANVSMQDYTTLGGLVVASMGFMFGPRVFAKMKFGSVPPLRPVIDAVPGTKAISTPLDLARAYDDINAPLLRIAERAGVPMPAVDALKDKFRIQTRGSAQAIADSAVIGGRAETPTYTFQVQTPLSTLHQVDNAQVSRYLHLWDTANDLNIIQTRQASQVHSINKPPPGPPTVRGMTMPDVLQELSALEATNPQLRQIGAAYKDNVKALRAFEGAGEYGTKTRKQIAWENANRPDEVPWIGEKRTLGNPVERGSATESLADDMRRRLRVRMENEANGMFVDEVRKANPDLFRRVTQAELDANPRWEKNVVAFYRRGKKEMYTTDPLIADLMKMDPYYMSGLVQMPLYATKRMLEMGATGKFAPWFAPVSMMRSYLIGKITAPTAFPGAKSPGMLRTAYAIPEQLVPQLANAIHQSIEAGSAGWIGRLVGQGNMQALSQRLANTYHNSLYHQLQSVGSHKGSILQQQVIAKNKLGQAVTGITDQLIASAPPTLRASLTLGRSFLRAFGSTVEAMHNAPSFAFASKNYAKVPLNKLAVEARHMTGDPRIGGQYYVSGGFANKPRPIRFENTEPTLRGRLSQTTAQAIRYGYGAPTEIGRTALPWFNVTMQGIKRIGEAYLKNPVGFTTRAWMYSMMPSAALYMYTRSLDKDPNGRSYSDYHMNGRSDYKKTMNYYIPIPGRPAEEGIELPRFHELAPANRMMEVALDHAFRSNVFTQSEDFARTAQSFMDIAITPPAPPIVGMWAATHGMTAPTGVFGGETYKRRTEPFDQTGGLPTNIELFVRALASGIGDVIGAGAAAFSQTPDGLDKAVKNFGIEAGKRAISKTPILRDVTGILPPASGNTNVTEELFKKQRALKQLDEYYKTWDVAGGQIGLKPRSKSGEELAAQKLGERPPPDAAGINQPEPTNPLYKMFMEEVHAKFMKDATQDRKGNDTGALGFQSLWNRYSIATRQISRLNKVNAGNYVTWQDQLEDRPEQVQYLEKNGVDTTDPIRVKNFYERQRQDAARVILFTIRAVEDDFSKRLGRPVKLEDLNPYGKGIGNTDTGTMDYDLSPLPY